MRVLRAEFIIHKMDRFSLRRNCNIFLLVLMMWLPHVLSAESINVLTPVTVTIPTRYLNDAWILCTAPIASCDANSPIPLISVDIQASSYPAFSDVDVIHNVNSNLLKSGYITFIGLDASALDDVVIGLRDGFVNVGDPWPFAFAESRVAADLLAGDSAAMADLRVFFLSDLTAFPQIFGTGGTLYRFSSASIVGAIGPTVVTPEPSTVALTALALLTLVILSRRGKRGLVIY